jgi:exosortase
MLWRLHGLWNPDGAYAYAWAAPFLAAYLLWRRWEDRPAPGAAMPGAMAAAIALAVLALPACWLREAAPERGVCEWGYAAATVGVSLALMGVAGGAGWARWFAFPLCFLLTATPWPHGLELAITNPLMHRTASATVEILCLSGVPAAQAGNLVHIESGVIDIDEACSGIRSLQAMVMLALFLGELFRLRPWRRIALLALGLAVTLGANTARTVALSMIGHGHGMGAVDRAHDAAGLAVLISSLALTLGAAFLMRGERVEMRGSGDFRTAPFALSAALIVWAVAAQAGVEAWYRLHEPPWQGWRWSVQWPRGRDDFNEIAIPPRSLRLLTCDESRAAEWKEPGGAEWTAYWLRWNPGNAQAEAAKVHRPDVCLNAEGAVMQDDMGILTVTAGGMQIPFHSYTFRLGEKTLYVFFCLSEEGGGAMEWNPKFESVDMVQRALEGQRRFGLQSLEVALSGYKSEAEALGAFRARTAEMVGTGR